MNAIETAHAVVRAIRLNVDAYMADAIDHAEFSRVQGEIWRALSRVENHNAAAILRDDVCSVDSDCARGQQWCIDGACVGCVSYCAPRD